MLVVIYKNKKQGNIVTPIKLNLQIIAKIYTQQEKQVFNNHKN